MKVTMMLADYAQAVGGKLYIMGGGWSVTGPEIPPFAIALDVKVPWDQTNEQHVVRLELLDADGAPVHVAVEGAEPQPVFAEGTFEVGRPPGVKPGTPIDFALAINFSPPPPIAPGGRYEWRLSIDGESRDDWRVAFTTRPAP